MTSEEVKKLRKKLKLTQADFAQRVGVTVTTVSRWENGLSVPTGLSERKLEELKEQNNG